MRLSNLRFHFKAPTPKATKSVPPPAPSPRPAKSPLRYRDEPLSNWAAPSAIAPTKDFAKAFAKAERNIEPDSPQTPGWNFLKYLQFLGIP